MEEVSSRKERQERHRKFIVSELFSKKRVSSKKKIELAKNTMEEVGKPWMTLPQTPVAPSNVKKQATSVTARKERLGRHMKVCSSQKRDYSNQNIERTKNPMEEVLTETGIRVTRSGVKEWTVLLSSRKERQKRHRKFVVSELVSSKKRGSSKKKIEAANKIMEEVGKPCRAPPEAPLATPNMDVSSRRERQEHHINSNEAQSISSRKGGSEQEEQRLERLREFRTSQSGSSQLSEPVDHTQYVVMRTNKIYDDKTGTYICRKCSRPMHGSTLCHSEKKTQRCNETECISSPNISSFEKSQDMVQEVTVKEETETAEQIDPVYISILNHPVHYEGVYGSSRVKILSKNSQDTGSKEDIIEDPETTLGALENSVESSILPDRVNKRRRHHEGYVSSNVNLASEETQDSAPQLDIKEERETSEGSPEFAVPQCSTRMWQGRFKSNVYPVLSKRFKHRGSRAVLFGTNDGLLTRTKRREKRKFIEQEAWTPEFPDSTDAECSSYISVEEAENLAGQMGTVEMATQTSPTRSVDAEPTVSHSHVSELCASLGEPLPRNCSGAINSTVETPKPPNSQHNPISKETESVSSSLGWDWTSSYEECLVPKSQRWGSKLG